MPTALNESTTYLTLELNMNSRIKKIAISALAVGAITAGAAGTAQAQMFYYRPAVVVAPAPVYVPVCHLVSTPVINPWTGWSYMVTRTVCN